MVSTEKLSFDQLPEAVVQLTREVASLREFIQDKLGATKQGANEDKWLSVEELCEYLPDKPSKYTVYTWVSNRAIPYHKKMKRLSFRKSEIDKWLEDARRKTADELYREGLEAHGYKKGGLL